MSALDSFPLGQPAFVTHVLDRAAHLRNDDANLLALEGKPDFRAYVVHRNSLIVNKENGSSRVLLTIDEALQYGANPGTIFLGLREGAAIFGMGIGAPAVEKLLTRQDVAVSELRGMAMQGVVPPDSSRRSRWRSRWSAGISAMAIAPIRHPHRDEAGRLEARLPELQGRAFSATDPVVIMLVTSGDKVLLGRQKQFLPGQIGATISTSPLPRGSSCRRTIP